MLVTPEQGVCFLCASLSYGHTITTNPPGTEAKLKPFICNSCIAKHEGLTGTYFFLIKTFGRGIQ